MSNVLRKPYLPKNSSEGMMLKANGGHFGGHFGGFCEFIEPAAGKFLSPPQAKFLKKYRFFINFTTSEYWRAFGGLLRSRLSMESILEGFGGCPPIGGQVGKSGLNRNKYCYWFTDNEMHNYRSYRSWLPMYVL